jgi:hypothetical protein
VSETSFDRVITEHLALSERNRRLERSMPLERYRDQCGGAIVESSPFGVVEPSGEEEPPTQVTAAPRDEPASWWETEDGDCPPPPLVWNADH